MGIKERRQSQIFGKPTVRVPKIADIPIRDTIPGIPVSLLEAPEFKTETDSKPWWAFSEEFGQKLHTVHDEAPQFDDIEGDAFDRRPTTRYRAFTEKTDPTPQVPPRPLARVEPGGPWVRRYWGLVAVGVVFGWGLILFCIASLGISGPGS
jgi:hypothetical protein